MESNEQKKRRLYGKQYLEVYLKELNALTNINVMESMLLQITESDAIKAIKNSSSYRERIKFNEKEKLRLFFAQLVELKNGRCYLKTKYSQDCGALKLNKLQDFNVNFNFNDEHAGLISIILEDLSNELILDYYEENDEYYLDIEVFGLDWSNAIIG